jgi:hypothetical protein
VSGRRASRPAQARGSTCLRRVEQRARTGNPDQRPRCGASTSSWRGGPTGNSSPCAGTRHGSRTCTTIRRRPLGLPREVGRREARCRFLLVLPPPHPPDDFIDRSGSAGKRNVFRAGAVWNLALTSSARLFPLVMRSCVLAGLAKWHGHTVCNHSESVPSKYLNGTMSSRYLKHGQHTISPVSFSPLQPRHTVSVRAITSSSSISCLLPQPEQMHFINVLRYRIIHRVAGMRGKVSARPGVISHSPFLHFPPTARTYSCVKEREKNAACCMLRDAKHRTTLMRSDFVCNRILSLRSLSHKLESLQASYPHMSVRR